MQKQLVPYKTQEFLIPLVAPPALFFLPVSSLFTAASLPDQSLKILNFAYFDLKIKSYLLCILFVVLEEPQHSFKGVQNDFLNTFLSLLQLNKVEL